MLAIQLPVMTRWAYT